MNSMTGYGMASTRIGNLSIEIEVTSVNKRHLETIISAPKEWQRFEYDATKQIKSLFERGRIRAAINLIKNSEEEEEGFFEESIIEEDLERLESFLRKRNQAFEVTPELILRLADLRKNQTKLPPLEKVRHDLENTLSEACKNMVQMRQKEGLAIKDDLLARINCIRNYISQMDELSDGMAQEHKDKLSEVKV